jgi:GNAT superfamily N-acetyltransferase
VDLGLRLVPQPVAGDAAVLGFTGHIVVAAAVEQAWLDEHLRPGQLSEAFTPPFLGALADHTGRRVSAVDLVAIAPPSSADPGLSLTPVTDVDHPRVLRARRYRSDVSVWTVPGGLIALGRGLAGRWEVAIEVEDAYQNRGLGRALAAAARRVVPEDRGLWAQIAPGNAASVRAFLAAGYVPVGQEALLVTHGPGDD